MKKLLFGTILLAGLIVFPFMSMAQVHVKVNVPVPSPPPISFIGPPNVVVLPGTDVYAVPDVKEEFFFETVCGGDIMVDTGIIQNTMITDGLIIVVIPPGIKESRIIGETIMETMRGVDIRGIRLTSVRAILEIFGVVVIGLKTMDRCVQAVVGIDVT